MSGIKPHGQNSPKGHTQQVAADSMLRDPVVRAMVYVALGLVILFLAMVVSGLVTGVGTKPNGPRTAAERDLIVAAATVNSGGSTGAQWAPYVNALLASGDLRKARLTLDAARASVQATATAPELELAEARLEFAQKRYVQAARQAEKAMKGFEARQKARLAAGGKVATRAKELGIEADYDAAALVKAYSFVELRRWKDALAMFDLYISRTPTAADVLIDRGNAKASLKDNAGAEKDFRKALRFVPDDQEAKAGLKRIGAAE